MLSPGLYFEFKFLRPSVVIGELARRKLLGCIFISLFVVVITFASALSLEAEELREVVGGEDLPQSVVNLNGK